MFKEFSIRAKRDSLDKVANKRGRDLARYMGEKGFFVLNGRTAKDSPGKFTFVGSAGSSVIDHIWVGYDSLHLLSDFEVLPILTCSDHFPIKISISETLETNVSESTGMIYRSLKWDNNLKNEFQEFLVERTPTGWEVENMNDSITNLIYEFASVFKLFKNKRGCNMRKPWVDDLVREKKDIFKKALQGCKATNFLDEELTQTYRLARSDLVKTLRERRKIYFDSKIDAVTRARTAKEFWSSINFFRKNGKSSSDPIALEQWVQFYNDIFPVRQNLNAEIRELFNPLLDQSFTLDELEASIKKAKLNKSPGEDGIPAEYFKNLNLEWKIQLLKLFNKILETEVTPERWANIIVIMLYKKGLVEKLENYRPIALVDTILKLFTQMLNDRIIKWAENSGLLPEFQCGFRKNRSCTDNIFVLNGLINMCLNKLGGKLYALFVDFRRAFPSVNHNILWRKLSSLGMSSKMIRILIFLYIQKPQCLSETNRDFLTP